MKKIKFLILFFAIGVIIFVASNFFIEKEAPNEILKPDIFSEVWSQNSPKGKSYEFKVNCGSNYAILGSCFLYELDEVYVIHPEGRRYDLKKDFNINNYSGEITRRWVLYGEQNSSLPITGEYVFEFVKNKTIAFRDSVKYVQSYVSYPYDIKMEKREKSLAVKWKAPGRIKEGMWYKIIIWNEADTPQVFVSKQFDWNATEGVLENVPLVKNGNYSLNAAVFYRGGYAYSDYSIFSW